MSQRPEHATDCPGCDTGWCVSALLCPMCTNAVTTSNPELYDRYLSAWAEKARFPGHIEAIATEAYRRGLVVGTARVLNAQRIAQRDAWRQKKLARRKRP